MITTNNPPPFDPNKLNNVTRELEKLKERLIETTLEYGNENDYCIEGMAEFVSKVLNCSASEAEDLLKQQSEVDATVTVRVHVSGWVDVIRTVTASRYELEDLDPERFNDYDLPREVVDLMMSDDIEIESIEIESVEED